MKSGINTYYDELLMQEAEKSVVAPDSIKIYNNTITNQEGIKIANAIKEVIIKRCSVYDSTISVEGANKIADELKVNNRLISLDIIDSDIPGIKVISEALKINKGIRDLNLFGNIMGNNGTELIAEVLKVNCSIKNIRFGFNRADYRGIKKIAEALKINKGITSVDLSNSWAEDKGVETIAKALKINKSITNIRLADTMMDYEGMAFIAEALKVNKSINSIDLSDNKLSYASAMKIGEALKLNQSIIVMYLKPRDFDISDYSTSKVIAKALQYNTSILHMDLPDPDIQIRLLKNRREFALNCTKVIKGELLNSMQYSILFSQLSFISTLTSEEKLREGYGATDIYKVKNFADQQVRSNLFLLKGVCKSESLGGQLPSDVTKIIADYVQLGSIKNKTAVSNNSIFCGNLLTSTLIATAFPGGLLLAGFGFNSFSVTIIIATVITLTIFQDFLPQPISNLYNREIVFDRRFTNADRSEVANLALDK